MVVTKARTKHARKSATTSRKAALAKARAAKAAKQICNDDDAPVSVSPQPVTPQSTLSTPVSSSAAVSMPASASKRKLELPLSNVFLSSSESSLPLAIVDLNLLAKLFSSFQCRTCGHNLCLSTGPRKGFAHHLKVVCDNCNTEEDSMCTSSSTTTFTDDRCYNINRKIVLAFLNVGLGFAGMTNFCETLGMDGLTEVSYNRHVKKIHDASCDAKRDFLDEAAVRVRSCHGATSDDVLDLAVSYDGTWQKRGHTSKHGLGAVIELSTGLVLDYQVMATYCQQCASVGAKMKEQSDEDYQLWLDGHKSSCTINHQGSSGLMEVEVAKVLWGRSIERGFRYTTLVSDGDCKTHNRLLELSPYGDTPIIKEECTNHVAKRLGTGLRNLVSSEKAKGVTLGGRKAGSLTQAKIATLQAHYKKAAASKCFSVDELRRKIWCTFSHASSTDENPQHHDCPTGQKSWCFYQRALSFGKEPPSHKGKSSSYISECVAKAVRPIYDRLTSDELLQRCLKGLTQNANESLHSTIWAKAPKHLFSGRRRLEIAAALAIGNFNCGSRALQQLMQQSGCVVHHQTIHFGRIRDRKRVSAAELRRSEEVKRRRTEIARATSLAQQEYLHLEDGASYASGEF